MNDYLGNPLKRGDWIFYATSGEYRFARIIYTGYNENQYKERACIIPFLKDIDYTWRYGIKSYIYRAPFRVTEVPESVLQEARTHKMWKEWFND